MSDPDRHGRYKHYAYARCTAEEYATIQRFAARENLSVSNFMRRCVNSWLLEEGDDVVLLEEKSHTRRLAGE